MRNRPVVLTALLGLGSALLACHTPSTAGARPEEAPPTSLASPGGRPFVSAGEAGEAPGATAPAPAEAASPTPPPPALLAPPPESIGPLAELFPYNVLRLNGNFADFEPIDIDPDSGFDPTDLTLNLDIDLVWLDFNKNTVYDMRPPNTPDIEFRPYPVLNNRFVFYVTNQPGNLDIWRYDTRTHIVNTLGEVNNDDNQFSVTPSLDGDYLAYLEGPLLGEHRLFRHSLKTGERWAYGGYLRLPPLTRVRNLSGNLDVSRVAFAANNAHDADIFMVDFHDGVCELPPFVNTVFNETFPWLSPDGNLLLFVSDRAGSRDVYMVDLRNGRLDNLPFANTQAIETSPMFIGGTSIVFISNRSGRFRLYRYDWKTEVLDTLAWVDSQLQFPLSPNPLPVATPLLTP